MTAVLQLKTRILDKLEAVYFLYRFSHSKRLVQLSMSPVPQSSPPNRDGGGGGGNFFIPILAILVTAKEEGVQKIKGK